MTFGFRNRCRVAYSTNPIPARIRARPTSTTRHARVSRGVHAMRLTSTNSSANGT
jgi:hypothetical protein